MGVIGTVNDEDVYTAPAKLAVVVVTVGVVATEKFAEYLTHVYTR